MLGGIASLRCGLPRGPRVGEPPMPVPRAQSVRPRTLERPQMAIPAVRTAFRFPLPRCGAGSALPVMLFLETLIRALLIFNGLRSPHCQRALLVYHTQ